jgi:hypothetical protein
VLFQVVSFLFTGLLICLVIWTYRAATAARRLGLPAQRETIWAALGWFVPVVSFWFPCVTLQDCLPPTDVAGRRLVLQWWLLSITSGLLVWAAAAAIYQGGGVIGAAGVLVLAGYEVAMAVLGVRVIDRVGSAHTEALAVASQ